MLDCHHPSVYKLVEQFRKEQDYNELKIERIRCGEKQPVASKANRKKFILLVKRKNFL